MSVEAEKKPKKKAFPAVFDPEPKVKEMAAKISFFEPDTEEGEAIVPDVPIPTGSFDGCSFPATAQASWRSAFSVISRMADEWLKKPKQQATKMKSERIHGEMRRTLQELQRQWSLMNDGKGRWA